MDGLWPWGRCWAKGAVEKQISSNMVAQLQLFQNVDLANLQNGGFDSLSLHQARAVALEFLSAHGTFAGQHGALLGDHSTRKQNVTNMQTLGEKPSTLLFEVFYLSHYLPFIQSVKRSWRTDVSLLKNHLLPRFESLHLEDIRPFMVKDLMESMVSAGYQSSTCNRTFVLLKYMFSCAFKWELMNHAKNPCQHIRALKTNNAREKYLTSK